MSKIWDYIHSLIMLTVLYNSCVLPTKAETPPVGVRVPKAHSSHLVFLLSITGGCLIDSHLFSPMGIFIIA